MVKAANEKGRLVALLEKWAKELNVPAGAPVIPPKSVSAPIRADEGRRLPPAAPRLPRREHRPRGRLVARVPGGELPRASRATSGASCCRRRASRRKPGAAWDIDKDAAASFLRYFYPQAEDTTDRPADDDRAAVAEGNCDRLTDGVARGRVEGDLVMKRPFYPGRPNPGTVEAGVLGFMSWDTKGGNDPVV